MNAAIILAGGTGTRTGLSVPKQFISVNGKSLIQYSLDVIVASKHTDLTVVVCEKEYEDLIKPMFENGKPFLFACPGDTRQLSVLSALKCIKDKTDEKIDTVMIYDAARPYITAELIEILYGALGKHDGVMPVIPMKDTVYECEDGRIVGLLNRDRIFAGQAPELFVFDKYYDANIALTPDAIRAVRGSSEPAVMYGMDIVTVPGDERNSKITTREDVEKFYEGFSS